MVTGRFRRAFFFAFTAAFFLGCILSLVVPFPQTFSERFGEIYRCIWEDGSETAVNYLNAYKWLDGTDGENVVVQKDGLRGKIAMDAFAKEVYVTLSGGALAELLSVRTDRLNRIECAAIYRVFGNTLFCDGDCFRFTGTVVERCGIFSADRVELLGTLPETLLKETKATSLHIRSGAKFSSVALESDSLANISADAPYVVRDGAIYLQTAGGVRLIAGCPYARTLTVSDTDFYDENAFAVCKNIEELTLPFLCGTDDGAEELGFLFGTDENGLYAIPQSLKTLKITGGKVGTTAFYRAYSLEIIDLCGIARQDIAKNAFDRLPSLRVLHCALPDALPETEFFVESLPCGCLNYRRKTL